MKNQVIKNLNPEMGKEIIKYFQSLGVDTCGLSGTCCVQDNDPDVYYGVIGGGMDILSEEDVQKYNAEIVELPKQTEFKRGDKVLVSNMGNEYAERIFVAYVEGAITPYVCVDNAYEIGFKSGRDFHTSKWEYCKAIPVKEEPSVVELTLKDISEGKGVGVPVELLRIKAD